MSEAKRYEAVHLRYEESNIRYGEGCEVEVVAAYDFDTLAQRLQEAERALQLFVDLGITRGDWVELDEALSCASNILAGKGGKS